MLIMQKEEKVFFKTSDGLTLCGILSKPTKLRGKTPRVDAQKCIVLCHGITADKDEGGRFVELAKDLVKAGFAVFRFDFRAHGESEGDSIKDFTIRGEILDLEAAVVLLERKEFNFFGIVAASFAGGAVSYFIADNEQKVKALVLWNAVIYYSKHIEPDSPWGKKYWGKPAIERIEKYGFTEIGSKKLKVGRLLIEEIKSINPLMQLESVSIPILILHGDKDKHISYKDSVNAARLLKNARLKIIKEAEHGFHNPQYAKQAVRATVDFFVKHS